MVYGMFVMLGAVTALFFLFNTGQLSREKTKLVNASDAVAYSAGVLHARTLNYQAYLNRAMLANTVAIAQLVSLSSWIQYTSTMGSPYGFMTGANLANPKFALFYPSYLMAQSSGDYMQEFLNDSGALEILAKASDEIVRDALMIAQETAELGLLSARQQVMAEVAQANYQDDGSIAVDALPLAGNDFPSFVSRYSGKNRTRLAEVAETAANRDSFVSKRSWAMSALWSDCPGALVMGRLDWLERRGGTNLIGFDEWKALDTLSEKRWVPSSKTDIFCEALAEFPAAWGFRPAADNPGFDFDLDPTLYDYAMLVNPGASGMAIMTSSSTWGYSGLPDFYDLAENPLKQDNPRFRFAVRLRRNKNQTLTSEGRSDIQGSGSHTRLGRSINAYQAQPAGGDELVAVAAAEVFFERDGGSKDNGYGSELGRPREIGSLFNPYWQVHLIPAQDEVRAAQALQGAVLP